MEQIIAADEQWYHWNRNYLANIVYYNELWSYSTF